MNSPVCTLSLYLGSATEEVSNFDEILFIDFFFLLQIAVFGIESKNFFPSPSSQGISHMFFAKSFTAVHFTFKDKIHF